MVKTYIRAPNWSTAPPPEGRIRLGHLLQSLEEFSPVNQTDVPTIENENPIDVKTGVTLNVGRGFDGELGVFANFLALCGIGLSSSLKYGIERTTELSFGSFETFSFNPDDTYVENLMALDAVQSHMKKHNYKKPLYLITGLKVGRNGSMTDSKSSHRGASLEVGVTAAPVPVEIGPKVSLNTSASNTISYDHSSDFIVAFQVRKVRYVKGNFSHEIYKRRAEYHGERDVAVTGDEETQMTLEVTEDVSALDFEEYSEIWEGVDRSDDLKVMWVVPKEEE